MKLLICLSAMLLFSVLSLSGARAMVVLPASFTFNASMNSTIHSVFRITPENVSSAIDIIYSCPFQITFNQTHWDSLSTFFDNEFDIHVPYEANAQQYAGVIWVQGENETERINLTINVQEQRNFTVPASIEKNFSSGDQGVFFIELNNTGNTQADVLYSVEGNIFQLADSGRFTIFPRMNYEFPVFYLFPEDFTPGNYTVNITFNDGFTSNKTAIKLNITDNQTPDIFNIEYNTHQQAAVEFPISFSVKDNKEIDSIWMIYNGDERMDFDNDKEKQTAKLKFYKKGEEIVSIHANDTSGNENTVFLNFTLYPNEITQVFDIGYYQLKAGYTIKKPLLHSDEPITMKARLTDVKYRLPNETLGEVANYRIALGIKGKEFTLEHDQWNELDNENITDLDFIFESNWTGDFQATIELYPPDWVKEDPYTVEFRTFVGAYDIPEYVRKIIGNVVLDCKPNISVENFPDSKWVCTETHPIDTDVNNIGRFMTGNEYDAISQNFETQKQTAVNERNQVIFQWQIFAVFLAIALIIVGTTYVFFGRGITYVPWW